MLKKLLSLTLVACLFFQTFSNLTIVAWFKVQQDYFEEVFCINKDKPMMQCHGTCYLSKKLNESKKKQKDSPVSVELREITFIADGINMDMVLPERFRIKQEFRLTEGQCRNFIPSIFHPPKV